MVIKHFQGYGRVNAKKVSNKKVTDAYGREFNELVINVTGNHECGLALPYPDNYSVYQWLVSKFDKSCESYLDIETMKMIEHDFHNVTYKIYIKRNKF